MKQILSGTDGKHAPRLGKPPTIAVLVDGIIISYQRAIVSGIVDTARSAGANLLCLVGGMLRADRPDAEPHNRVFELVRAAQIDGVIVIAPIVICQVGRSSAESYLKKHFGNLPLVSIGVALEGFPSVVTSNQSGIRDMAIHLAKVHNFRKIAFVRGPINNDEAEERYRSYVDTLQSLDIPVDARLVTVGDFGHESGMQAVRSFAKQPGLQLAEIDAIMAANDAMAIGVMTELAERGIAIPRTVAVAGFDDMEEGPFTDPPLTTVRQSVEKLGKQATNDLLKWIQVGTVPTTTQIDTEIVIRSSCGCSTRAAGPRPAIAARLGSNFESAVLLQRQHILDALTLAARARLGFVGSNWEGRLLMAFVSDSREESVGAFRRVAEDLGTKVLKHNGDIQVCHDLVQTLRAQLWDALKSDIARLERAETEFYETHLALSALARIGVERDRIKLERWVRDVSHICNELAGARDLCVMKAEIYRELHNLGLRNYYVVLESSVGHGDTAELFAGCTDGREVVNQNEQAPFSESILPKGLMPVLGNGRPFAAFPLLWQDHYFGYLLLELELEHAFSYASIAEAMAIGFCGSRFGTAHSADTLHPQIG